MLAESIRGGREGCFPDFNTGPHRRLPCDHRSVASLTPEHLSDFWPDRDWDNRKLWSLELPTSCLPLDDLTWVLDLPVWSSRPPSPLFDLVPRTVLESPQMHAEHALRIQRANLEHPLLVHRFRGRWVVLDGIHRLAKLVQAGAGVVTVQRVGAGHLAVAVRDH